eukprot:TRINITY_DN1141_c2_g1_i2.p1 TRINITY_DN1141_c2_g1~~TRINITY_DN1141_c2_g1_i2.p1  ORF type:complete len:175 (+),score=29.30 TRINITY_DN1141_c2_g1_i2:64-588(+)
MPPKHGHAHGHGHHAQVKCGGCNYAVTGVTPTHCCHACHGHAGTHGPMCKKQLIKCQGCDYAVTGVTATHCCNACHGHAGHHGPMCQKLASGHVSLIHVKGAWKNADGADVTLIDQVDHTITCTNAAQGWSPAVGRIDGNTITFQSGGLVGLVGTLSPCHKRITFNNNCAWVLV